MINTLKRLFRGFRGRNVLVIFITWCLFQFVFSAVDPYLSLYYRPLGATPKDLGMTITASNIALVPTLIVGAYIADFYGRRRIVVLMTYLLIVPLALCALAQHWTHLLIASVLMSLIIGTYRPALEAIVAYSMPPEVRGTGFSILTSYQV